MKRFFCLICIILLSCRLTWAQAYGESEAGTQSSVTYTHEADCDSAHIDFGYDGDGGADSLNFYVTVDLLPCFSGDGTILTGEGLELDSIGGHVFKVTYFLDDGDAVADGYVGGLWLNKNPSSGDTIQREASTHGASDVATLWGDTLALLIAFRDSANNAIADANKPNFKADVSGLSTFDHTSDKVTLVDSSAEDVSYTKNNPDDFKASLPDSYTIDKSNAWGLGVEVNTKTGFKLAQDGLDTDTSFLGLQDEVAGIKVKTDKLTFNPEDSLIIDYSNIPMVSLPDSYTIDISDAWGLRSGLSTLTRENVWETDISGYSGAGHAGNYLNNVPTNPSTFDPASDNVAVVDSVTGVARVDSVRKVYIVDSLDQTITTDIDSNIIYRQNAYVVNDSNMARYVTRDDYKGAAAGLTKEQIAVTVRDTASNRPDIWTDQASGTGADTFNIYVFDADTTAVEGVSITIYNKAHTAVAAPSLVTDVNGLTTTFQDADTFHLYLQRLGVIYAQWDTIVVSNQGIDTIWVTAYDPGVSPSPSLTCIQGYNGDVGGNTDDRLTITLRPIYSNLIDTATGIFIVAKEHYAYSDTGFFTIYVTPSANLVSKQATGDVDSVRYDLIVKKGYIKQFERKNIFVPIDAGCIWLKDILD